MEAEIRPQMRGGKGECLVTFLAGRQLQKHVKLFSLIDIPVGAGIGPHSHSEETEYYYVVEGEGFVDDNGEPRNVKPGDVVVTTGGDSHSVENTGAAPLKMIAVIVTDA
jgi:mannose-6-phosphate isomerase-like protein (cupin superfamily)